MNKRSSSPIRRKISAVSCILVCHAPQAAQADYLTPERGQAKAEVDMGFPCRVCRMN